MHNPLSLPLTILILTTLPLLTTASNPRKNLQRDIFRTKFKPTAYQAASPDVNVSSWVTISRGEDRKNSHLRGFVDALRKGKVGLSVLTSVQLGQAWYTPITVGGKTFKVLVDTGSSDTWLATKDFKCFTEDGNVTPQAECAFGPLYDPGRELTPVGGVNFNIQYGDGSFLRGGYGMTKVTLGGITVKQQLALARETYWLGDDISSGLMGLAYPSLTFAFSGSNFSADTAENQIPYNPIFTTMYTQQKIAPVFSMAIGRPSTPPGSAPEGYLALGGLAPVATIGKWAKAPIEYVEIGPGYINGSLPYPQYQWYTLTPDAFFFTTTPSNLPPIWQPLNIGPSGTPKFQAIIDSGVTHTWLPPSIANHVASLFVPPAVWNADIYAYTVPCNATVPQIAVKINGVILPWDRRDLIMDDFTGRGGCVSGVNNGGSEYELYTLGDTWMRSNLVVFDVGAAELRIKSRGYY